MDPTARVKGGVFGILNADMLDACIEWYDFLTFLVDSVC